MAAIDGKMSISLVVLFATLGADIGALFNYYLARVGWDAPIVFTALPTAVWGTCA